MDSITEVSTYDTYAQRRAADVPPLVARLHVAQERRNIANRLRLSAIIGDGMAFLLLMGLVVLGAFQAFGKGALSPAAASNTPSNRRESPEGGGEGAGLASKKGRWSRIVNFGRSSAARIWRYLLVWGFTVVQWFGLLAKTLWRALVARTTMHVTLAALVLGGLLAMARTTSEWPTVAFWLSVLLAIQVIYQVGFARSNAELQLGRIFGSFAGILDSLTQDLGPGLTRRLREPTAKSLAIALLARVKQIAEYMYEPKPSTRLRVTLAVPIFEPGGAANDIRVWCYDQPYANRRWSTLRT
ncbi:MAG: hypothetical protein WB810_16360, partial [Candidatus Cybelea sp.]